MTAHYIVKTQSVARSSFRGPPGPWFFGGSPLPLLFLGVPPDPRFFGGSPPAPQFFRGRPPASVVFRGNPRTPLFLGEADFLTLKNLPTQKRGFLPPIPLLPGTAGGYTPGLPDHASRVERDSSATGAIIPPCLRTARIGNVWSKAGICIHFFPHQRERMEQRGAPRAGICLRSLELCASPH